MRSPTTRPVVVSASDDATVRVWDLDARGLLYEPLEAHKGKVNAVAVGELRGRPIAVSGGNDRTVRVWDLTPGDRCARRLCTTATSWRWPWGCWVAALSRCLPARTSRCGGVGPGGGQTAGWAA
jgi:WD40 repeat protein